MNKHILYTVILFFFSATLAAQTASLTLGAETGCADQEVLIPVTAYDLNNVSAITLFIGFDTTHLQFKNIMNVDPQLEGSCSWNLMQNPVQLGFVWSGVTPVNLTQKKLFDLKFDFLQGSAAVTFNAAECELVDMALKVIPVNLVNGSIQDGGNISLTTNPHDTAINAGMNASLMVSSSNALNYRWKVSSTQGGNWFEIDNGTHYSGVHSHQLDIIETPISYNNNWYLCTIDNGFCEVTSLSAVLQVDSLLAINDHLTQTIQLNQNQPNPFSLATEISYNLPHDGAVRIHIYNFTGIEVLTLSGQWQPSGQHSMFINSPELNSGLYFYNLEVTQSILPPKCL